MHLNWTEPNLRSAVSHFWLRPTFHVLIFVYNPHGSFHIFFSHEAFMKRQVMAHSVLLKMDNATLERMLKSEKKERNM